ncbi:MAG TPA: hypothetical protein VFV52_00760 [Bacilli bacterium]|nr:hypothetical protein [Bacilli bacterium]
MALSRQTVYDLEEVYDVVAELDEEQVDKMFTKLQPILRDVVGKNKYGKDEIDDRLVELFVAAAKQAGVEEKWAKGYLFYVYFDDEEE